MCTIVWATILSKYIGSVGSHFVQGLLKGSFHSVREKSILQCEFIGSRSITQTVKHSDEAGDSTAVT